MNLRKVYEELRRQVEEEQRLAMGSPFSVNRTRLITALGRGIELLRPIIEGMDESKAIVTDNFVIPSPGYWRQIADEMEEGE